MSEARPVAGALVLVPNTLDLGSEEIDIREVLPDGVLRAAAALRHWAAEDARTTRAFLKRVAAVHPLAAPLQSIAIQELPRPSKGPARGPAQPHRSDDDAWQALLRPAAGGHDLGLIAEAGLPAVADPGARLVAAAHSSGIAVRVLAGPSSLLLALAASGLNGQSFAFVGYLPQDAAARMQRARELEALSRRLQQTQLIIETPYRNAALHAALLQALAPETRLSVACGLTLPGGFTDTASVAQWRRREIVWPARMPAVFGFLAA